MQSKALEIKFAQVVLSCMFDRDFVLTSTAHKDFVQPIVDESAMKEEPWERRFVPNKYLMFVPLYLNIFFIGLVHGSLLIVLNWYEKSVSVTSQFSVCNRIYRTLSYIVLSADSIKVHYQR